MGQISMPKWAQLSSRYDALLSTNDMFKRLEGEAANNAQATIMLRTAMKLGADMLGLRQSIVVSHPDHGFSGEYYGRLQTLVEDNMTGVASPKTRASNANELVVLLSYLRADLEAFFHDGQEAIRLRVERAFLHLQWSIASTPSIRDAWKEAFKRGETQCESMGATHLLMHGIYAFKVSSSHARTDLVFNEPVDTDRATAVADGLVLTEWKKVKNLSKVEQRKVRSAAVQADHYATGVLGGIELRRVRYVVLVSEHLMPLPADEHHENHVVRFINIAVDPESPSAAATAISGSKPADSVAGAQA